MGAILNPRVFALLLAAVFLVAGLAMVFPRHDAGLTAAAARSAPCAPEAGSPLAPSTVACAGLPAANATAPPP